MARQKVPPQRGLWSDVSRICPKCIPDENSEIDLHACLDCLLTVVEKIPDDGACEICSQIIPAGRCTNHICSDSKRPFGKIYALGYRYKQNLLNRLINNLKFNYRYYELNSLPLAVLLWGFMSQQDEVLEDYDLIVPMPRTPEKVAREGDPVGKVYGLARSFLHSTDASGIADRMIFPEETILAKTMDTGVSYETDFWDKVLFANRVYDWKEECPFQVVGNPKMVKQKKILIIDDVFTSGYHAMFHASLAMKRAGANAVDGLALGRQMDTRWLGA